MQQFNLDEDAKDFAGSYELDKEWETDTTTYQQIIGEDGLKLVVATVKKTGSKHLLQPVDQEWDETNG